MIDVYLALLETGYYEVTFAFKGLSDDNVWKRPADGLLSIGELAGHIAYWEAAKFAGQGGGGANLKPDLSKSGVTSPLIDPRFAYYPTTIATPPSEQLLSMTAEQVCEELVRVHKESVAYFKSLNPDLDTAGPGWPSHYTYREFLSYAVFHVSYHTGQMYSVRHLLGDVTEDN